MRFRDLRPFRRQAAAVLALGMGAVVIVGACGGSGGRKADGGPGAAPTKEAVSAELGAALFTPSDLPAGFTQAPDSDDDGGVCKAIDQATKTDSTAQVEVAFLGSRRGPFIDQEVTSYSGGGATAAMRRVVKAVEGCASLEGNRDGSTYKASYSRAEFPEVGDEVVAARVEVNGAARLRGDVVFVRVGDAVIALANLGLETQEGPTFDGSLTEPLVRRAVEKLAKP